MLSVFSFKLTQYINHLLDPDTPNCTTGVFRFADNTPDRNNDDILASGETANTFSANVGAVF